MTQIVLDHVDEAVLAKLAELAKANRLSVEEQARKLLVEAINTADRRRRRLEIADRIAAMTPRESSRLTARSCSVRIATGDGNRGRVGRLATRASCVWADFQPHAEAAPRKRSPRRILECAPAFMRTHQPFEAASRRLGTRSGGGKRFRPRAICSGGRRIGRWSSSLSRKTPV
jgi:hypothetical protein